MTETLFVHLYSPPGVGKSTTMALCFGEAKTRGHNDEMLHEYAKERAWDGTLESMSQVEAAAEQLKRMDRVDGKVRVAWSDTSILLGLVYGAQRPEVTPAFRSWLMSEYQRRKTLNILLTRNPSRPYNPHGRAQTEEESLALDAKFPEYMLSWGLKYKPFQVETDNSHVPLIVDYVDAHL